MTPTVTLTTDFGHGDAYAAAMKGVILTSAPGVSCVDITHEVPPQDVLHGAYVLAEAVPFFPQGSVHAAVVDPGVGTDRRAIAVRVGGVHLVGPDNGVLSLAIEALLPASADWPLANEADEDDGALARTVESPAPAGVEVFELTDPAYRLAEVSNVFHGRDIFAPAAAHLCLGVDAARMGPRARHAAPAAHRTARAAGGRRDRGAGPPRRWLRERGDEPAPHRRPQRGVGRDGGPRHRRGAA